MLRPLIFGNSFRNIQKIKKGLSIKCCAPWLSEIFCQKYSENQKWAAPLISHFQRQLPPGGKPITKAEFINLCDMQQSVMKHPVGALRNGRCPPPRGEGYIKGKQVAPLDFRKFLSKKWAKHKMLRPLIFRNSFRNIQKIKNVLRPSSPPLRGRASPRGEAYEIGRNFKFMRFCNSITAFYPRICA